MSPQEEMGLIEQEVGEIHALQEMQRARLAELVARRDQLLFATGQASFNKPTGNAVEVPAATIRYKAQV